MFVVNIANVLDEDTGILGVVHVVVDCESDAKALVAEIVKEEEADPADFTIVEAPPNWECVGHGDGFMCVAPRLN